MITRRRVTPIPITPAIIKMVHRIAEQDGMPKGLKITNRTRQVLYDSTWIAGVDYDEDEFEDEDYHPSSDEDEDSDDSDDEDSDEEEQPQVEEPDEEEESEEESEEEQDPNPTTAEEQTIPENAQMTRSGRISKPRQVLNLYQSHLQAEAHQEVPYFPETTTATSNSTYKGKNKVLYVKMLKAIYGMLQSSLLYYKKFRKDIESIGFEANPYDPHVTNCIVNGNASSGEHTRHFHIKFFYITDLINRNEIQIKYCPTEDMIADYMETKFFPDWMHRGCFSLSPKKRVLWGKSHVRDPKTKADLVLVLSYFDGRAGCHSR
jgi:hypothetical protein